MALGIIFALCAQGGLYLGLRHASIATLPAWAHDRRHPTPWPRLVSVAVIPPPHPPSLHPAASPAPPPAPLPAPPR